MFSQASVILSTGIKGACMAGEACIARGHARQGVCMVGGMHGRGYMCDRGCVWQGGMHGRRDGHCSGQ